LATGSSNSIVSVGRLAVVGCSRLSKRLAVFDPDSSPRIIQPKFVDGSSSQACTSVTMPAELQVYGPAPLIERLALEPASKSPPALAHVCVLWNVCSQVASPVAASVPSPSLLAALEDPSPQSASTR
jgi:hypothetical protein